MTRLLSLLLITILVFPACAVRSASRFEIDPDSVRTPEQRASLSPAQWKSYLDRIPAGSKVKVRLHSGRTLGAVLMNVEADRLVVSPRTRIPEPPVVIPFEELAAVELDTGGIGPGKAVAIALGAAGAAVGALFLIVLALSGS